MKRWKIDRDLIASRDTAIPMAELMEYDLQESERAIERKLQFWMRNPASRQRVMEIFATLAPGPPPKGTPDEIAKKAVETIMKAFHAQKLMLLEGKQLGGSGGGEEGGGGGGAGAQGKGGGGASGKNQAKQGSSSQNKSEKTWIEIQLVDSNDDPVPGERYQLKITDGSMREGKLDEAGKVRVTNIDPGNCEVCFPDIDATEWQKV